MPGLMSYKKNSKEFLANLRSQTFSEINLERMTFDQHFSQPFLTMN
jgi:hypothetical protein